MLNGRKVDALNNDLVDAIVASEVRYALAKKQGFPVLLDTQEWNVATACNSVMMEVGWMADKTNQDSTKCFLPTTIEGLTLYLKNCNLALRVMSKRNGITDDKFRIRTRSWMPQSLALLTFASIRQFLLITVCQV